MVFVILPKIFNTKTVEKIVNLYVKTIIMHINTKLKYKKKDDSKVQVLLVLIDGLRPDAITKKYCPIIYSLAESGVCAKNAFTLNPPITLPSILSMFYSADSSEHGIVHNNWDEYSCKKPSLMKVLEGQGYKTAFINSWPTFYRLRTQFTEYILAGEGTEDPKDDLVVAEIAEKYIQKNGLDFLVVYFGGVDILGHKHGWMSEEYLNQVGVIDKFLGDILKKAHPDCTTFIVSDHGGEDYNHDNALSDKIMRITWIAQGTKIKKGYILEKNITHLDLAPTITGMYSIEADLLWAGESVASEISYL